MNGLIIVKVDDNHDPVLTKGKLQNAPRVINMQMNGSSPTAFVYELMFFTPMC